MDPIVFINMNPLITSNIRPSQKPTCIGSYFKNLLLVENYQNIVVKDPCAIFLLTFLLSGVFAKVMLESFINSFSDIK
jgi:hypothetical protein